MASVKKRTRSSCFVVSIYNHKGGVAKTTSTLNLGFLLANRGLKVLMVDLDPQMSLSWACIQRAAAAQDDWPEVCATSCQTLTMNVNTNPGGDAVAGFGSIPLFKWPTGQLNLCPGDEGISEYENAFNTRISLVPVGYASPSIVSVLRRTCEATMTGKNKFDVIILDTSPSFSTFIQNVLCSVDSFIIPTMPDLFSPRAINTMRRRMRSMFEENGHVSMFTKHNQVFPNGPIYCHMRYLGFIMSNASYAGNGSLSETDERWRGRILTASDELNAMLLEVNEANQAGAYRGQVCIVRDFISHGIHSQDKSIPSMFTPYIYSRTAVSQDYKAKLQATIERMVEIFGHIIGLGDSEISSVEVARLLNENEAQLAYLQHNLRQIEFS